VKYTLRELREAKGLTQKSLADALKISKSLYQSIENGLRRPSIDTLMVLSVIYQTSMDFIYHAFYRRRITWRFPDGELTYHCKVGKYKDVQFLIERQEPLAPPSLPSVIITEPE
jgi:transcriptional regulator with XRE-family HTH domain